MNVTPREFRGLWPEFSEPSWLGWGAIEDSAFAMEPSDPELVARVTGNRKLAAEPVREIWAAVGRGGGKSRWCARLACYFAAGRSYPHRAPGERIYVGVFAPDRRQSVITFKYVLGLIEEVPALANLVVRELRESVELSNGCTIEVITASKAAPRGRSYSLCVVEEAAFLPADESAEPDRELIRALRPGLARVPGSVLAVVSSPYAKRGELHKTYKSHYGKDHPSILVVQADTRTLNPSFDEAEIERAYQEDPESASAEYGAQFRADIESFVSHEVIEAATVPDRRELSPLAGTVYRAFVDPSGGSRDSFTLAIGHTETRDGQPVAVVDCLRERKAPFSPEAVVKEFASVLAQYNVRKVVGDRYAGSWPTEAFERYGIEYEPAPRPKSDLYRDALATLNAGRIELLDNPRLAAQITALERRTARGGKDSIDHPPGGRDDLANVVAGLAVTLMLTPAAPKKSFGAFGRGKSEQQLPATARDRQLKRFRQVGPGGFTEAGQAQYAHLLRDVPEGDLTPKEVLMMRRHFARRFGR